TERPEVEALDSHRHAIFYAQTRLLGFRRCGEQAAPNYLSEVTERPFFAFCGIGNPDAFFADLQRWHAPVAGTMAFRDHHKYEKGDIVRLQKAAYECGAHALVTTEKDEQNLSELTALGLPAYVAVIELVLPSEGEFDATLERLLAKRRGVTA